MIQQQLFWSVIGAVVFIGMPRFSQAQDLATTAQLRRPIAIVLSEDEERILVANHRSGTISLVSRKDFRVIQEFKVAAKLSDLVFVKANGHYLATDEEKHELLVLELETDKIKVRRRLPVSQYPVDIAVTSDGKTAYVTSLWSRRLTIVQGLAADSDREYVPQTIDLPFAPRRQLLTQEDAYLIIADSFGGRLLTFDTASQEIIAEREFPAHNIRGLGISANGKMLLVGHQMLNELAHTVRNDVHWGLLMSNDLRWLRLEAIIDESVDLYKGAHMHPLGEAGHATADPNRLAVAKDGTVVATLGGIGEIAVGKEGDFSLRRIQVGQRPTAVVITKDSMSAIVANQFSDSLSVVDLVVKKVVQEITLGPQPELSLVDRGEELFFDATLSHDGWMSCQSCHTDGHTNGLLNDNFSDKSFGAPKRVLSLLGKKATEPFAWNAAAANLEDQIRSSIQQTMQSGEPPEDEIVEALVAYVETLGSPPSIDVAREQVDEPAIQRGAQMFQSLNCQRCHEPPTFTTPATYDVGLVDSLGNDEYNPPTLLGVGQRGPYFHDNSAERLADVFKEFGHQLPRVLKGEELADLLAFLRSL